VGLVADVVEAVAAGAGAGVGSTFGGGSVFGVEPFCCFVFGGTGGRGCGGTDTGALDCSLVGGCGAEGRDGGSVAPGAVTAGGGASPYPAVVVRGPKPNRKKISNSSGTKTMSTSVAEPAIHIKP
jgi:hypothetical protein